ncbi:MAG TPA: GGDEF domain-containing protein, partial [Acidimicrobiales bacterium]|nr:GGDEF domain-containing protein [Acidimicrobiales bacterium]
MKVHQAKKGFGVVKPLLVIAGIAGIIRLATAVDPGMTAVVVGTLAVAAAVYGLWSNRRSHWAGWLVSWGFLSLGLVANIAAVVMSGWHGNRVTSAGTIPLVLNVIGDVFAVAGLGSLLHERLPTRLVESLAAAVVSSGALAFPILALVVVPTLGWHPGKELSAVAPPLLDIVMMWLTVSVVSLTRRHPVAYRYLLGGFVCMFVAHSLTAAALLAGYRTSPVPLDAVLLWGLCLWSCAILHPSQRHALDPIPFRSGKPGWIYIGLMVVGALVPPAVLTAKALLGIHNSVALFAAGSGVLPLLIVMYLTYQVYTRSAAEYRAQHDPLTGVCNRVLFNDRLESALADGQRAGRGVAVMFLDLDRFKSINDSLGHAVGNQLLQAVVGRLQSRLRPRDTLARMGGDEFTILIPDVDGKASGANLAQRILDAFY